MQEIKRPKCGELFTIDEAGYAAIVRQVRDKEFSEEIESQTKAAWSTSRSCSSGCSTHTPPVPR